MKYSPIPSCLTFSFFFFHFNEKSFKLNGCYSTCRFPFHLCSRTVIFMFV